jgi:hypothetical protein
MEERRRSARSATLKAAKVLNLIGNPLATCIVLDASAHGALLRFRDESGLPDAFILRMGREPARRVKFVRRDHARVGVEYA